MKKLISILSVMLLCLFFAAACGEHIGETGNSQTSSETAGTEAEKDTSIPFEPVQTCIFLKKDGSLQSAELTAFDNSAYEKERYTEDGLRKTVQGWMDEYNKTAGRTAISIDRLKIENNKALLVVNYGSAQDFMAFQGEYFDVKELKSMTAAEASLQGLVTGSLKNFGGGSVSVSEALAGGRQRVAAISGKCLVITEDEILACSESLVPTDTYSVRVDSIDTVYIIFK